MREGKVIAATIPIIPSVIRASAIVNALSLSMSKPLRIKYIIRDLNMSQHGKTISYNPYMSQGAEVIFYEGA